MEADEPTRVKIPKVDPNRVYSLLINKTQVYQKSHGPATVVLKKQVIGGYTIPHGTVISAKLVQSNSAGYVTMLGDEVNKMLKSLYIESLRTKKKNED